MNTLPDYIKPGTLVRTRNGRKAKIYEIHTTGDYPIHGAILFSDGIWHMKEWHSTYFCSSGKESPIDIVGPWDDRPDCSALWPLLPPWIKYLAMDKDYGWFGYTLKPLLGDFHAWNVIGDEYYFKIPSEHVPIYSGDWRDSLVERTQ